MSDIRHVERENEIVCELLEYGAESWLLVGLSEKLSFDRLFTIPEFQKFMYDLSWKPWIDSSLDFQ